MRPGSFLQVLTAQKEAIQVNQVLKYSREKHRVLWGQTGETDLHWKGVGQGKMFLHILENMFWDCPIPKSVVRLFVVNLSLWATGFLVTPF